MNFKTQMNNKLVSIIVPAYNGEKFLIKCIDSLLNQTYNSIEIIVIYDPSEDKTLDLLKKYGNKINLVQNTIKTSPGDARNIGLNIAKGEYIAFCDVDDFYSHDKIEKQVSILEIKGDVGLVYSDFFLIDSDGNIIETIKTLDWDHKKWISKRYIALSSILLRKSLVMISGYFDPKFHSSEDFDFLLRLSKITQFERLPESLMYRRIHENNLSKKFPLKSKITQLQIYFKHKMYFTGVFNFIIGLIISPIFYVVIRYPSLYHFCRVHMFKRKR